MKFETLKQDLMTVDAKYVICHCISADCAMGAGVVVPIKKQYTGVKAACEQFVKESGAEEVIGRAFRYQCPAGTVYNLFTKARYGHKAGAGMTEKAYHRNLRRCLEDTREQMSANGERYLAMPKIACGLDRCKWEDVAAIIQEVFGETEIEILVCVL